MIDVLCDRLAGLSIDPAHIATIEALKRAIAYEFALHMRPTGIVVDALLAIAALLYSCDAKTAVAFASMAAKVHNRLN